jgi:hypothetical protein
MIPNHFTRPIMLHVCKDGTVSYRDKRKREKVFNGRALPVFSVNMVEEAEQIQVRFCRLQYGDHPEMAPGTKWYRLTHFTGELNDLDRVTADFAGFYAQMLTRDTGRSKKRRAVAGKARDSAFKARGAVVDKLKRRRAGVE